MPANQECCLTSRIDCGRRAGSLFRSLARRSTRKTSAVLLPGIRINLKSGGYSIHRKKANCVIRDYDWSDGGRLAGEGGLTEDSADGVSAVALEIEKGRNTDNELVQEAAEGPQVRLPAVLLLEEELGRWVLERAEEGCCGDLWALFSRCDWRTWNWTGARRVVCDRFRLPRVVAVLWR